MTEPKEQRLTHALNQLIGEYGIKTVLQSLADRCFKEAEFLRNDRSTDLATNWEEIGRGLQEILNRWKE
ncbi:MAG: hypothetical protein ACP5D7_17520 [Limnospira sp.]